VLNPTLVAQVTGLHQSFGFVEFRTEEDADYACKVRVAAPA
jgi:RNA recognition motif. (a.k.a. RRM, RBD, or RNP domain)